MKKPIPFTDTMRDELVERHKMGASTLELARYFGVSQPTIKRWLVRDDVAVFVEFYGCHIPWEPAYRHYKGFAVDDLAKLARYVEAGAYRLKIGEQVRIKHFDPAKRTALCERLSSWAPRRLAVKKHPKYRVMEVGVPWIDLPVSALTADYEFTHGDYAYIKRERVQIKHLNEEQNTALVALEDGNVIEISADLIDGADLRHGSELANVESVTLEKQEVQVSDIKHGIVTALLKGSGREVEVQITLLTNSWVDRDGAIASHLSGEKKLKLGDYESAMSDFLSAIHVNAGFAEAFVDLGVARTKLLGDGAGLDDYCAAIRLDSDTALAYFKQCVSIYQLTTRQEQDFKIAACYNRCLPPNYKQYLPQCADNFKIALTRAKRVENKRLVVYIETWLEYHKYHGFAQEQIPRP